MGTSEPPLPSIASLLETGHALMRAREWERARDEFDRAVAADEHAVRAWEGVANAAMCLDDFDTARAAMERAFREAHAAGDWRTAARFAMQIAVFHEGFRGETAIANGWFERAHMLLDGHAPGPVHAWLALLEAHTAAHLRGDIVTGQQALATAVRLKDACGAGGELDLLARALAGLVAVSVGSVGDGLRQLDEATATAMSELPSPHIVGWISCYVLDACERVRDFDRAQQWIERGTAVGRQLQLPHFVAFCRSHYLSVLIGRGEYDAAETAIETVRLAVERIAPTYVADCGIQLAELRRRQGDLDGADALLERHRSHPQALLTQASLALDRGRAELATDLAERYLRRVPPSDRLRRLHGLERLIRAHVQRDREELARPAIEEIREYATDPAVPYLSALVSELDGLAAQARGDLDEARHHLEDAVDAYDGHVAPYEAAAARIALGSVLRELGRFESADAALSSGRRGAERLGARRLVDRADRVLGAAAEVRASGALTTREAEILSLVAEGISNHEIGERLCISAFTVKRHIANILTKLQQPSRAAAAAYAIREGLL